MTPLMEFEYEDTLMHALGIEILSMTPSLVQAKMPVDKRTHQPRGFLHGGASVALAETVASIGAALNVDLKQKDVFGVEINASHLRSMRTGWVKAVARPIKLGHTQQVWQIEICDEATDSLVCISRCTLAVKDRRVAKQ